MQDILKPTKVHIILNLLNMCSVKQMAALYPTPLHSTWAIYSVSHVCGCFLWSGNMTDES